MNYTILYAADSNDALKIAEMLMRNGYRVQVGPMESLSKGVRVTVWLWDKEV